MSSNDDIEKLLAEVSGTTAAPSPAGTPATRPAAGTPAKAADGKPGGRLAFAVVAAVILGIGGFLVGWLTPFIPIQGFSMGLGAAFAAFVTALLAGPPRWFSS